MYIYVHYFLKGDDMKTWVKRTQRKRFVSLLLVFSAMVSLLVPFDITAFADAPATGGDIRAVIYDGKELVFMNSSRALDSTRTVTYDSFDKDLDGNIKEDSGDWDNLSNIVPLSSAVNSNNGQPQTAKRTSIPWYAEDGGTITTVTFLDEIQPTSTAFWFSDMKKVTAINNLSKLDTSKVTCMTEMFRNCQKVASLDVGHFDTSKCESLWDTFNNCQTITSLDVSRWDVSNVGGAAGLFYGCNNLLSIDVSNWRTSKMFNMQGMFRQCRKLTMLDLHNFDFSKVKLIQDFCWCSSYNYNKYDQKSETMALETVIFPSGSYDTPELQQCYRMFAGCPKLKSIDIHGFNFTKVYQAYMMFYKCTALETINANGFNGYGKTTGSTKYLNESNTGIVGGIFEGCAALKSLDLSGMDFVSKSANNKLDPLYKDNFFTGTSSLKRIVLGDKFMAGLGSLEFENWVNIDTYDYKTQSELIGNYMPSYAGTWEVSSDIVLYGNRGTPSSQGVAKEAGKPVDLSGVEVPTRKGYTFGGWYAKKNDNTSEQLVDGQLAPKDSENVPIDTFYAYWNPISYDLKLKGNSGTAEVGGESVTELGPYTLAYDEYHQLSNRTFEKEGYILTHWNTRSNGSGDSYDAVDEVSRLTDRPGETITLYAQWHKPDVTINFDAGEGATTVPEKHYTLNTDGTTTYGKLSETSKDGYTFCGWYDEEGNKVTENTPVWKTQTLTARWEKNPIITFDANGGSFIGTASTSTKVVRYGTALGTTPTPTKENSTFAGWFTSASGGAEITSSKIIENDATYFAHWGYKPVFNAKGGTIINMPEYSVQDDPNYTISVIPEAKREGYTFLGWFYKDETSPIKAGRELDLSQGNTLIAKWAEKAKLQVTLDPDGGTITGNYESPAGDPDKRIINVYYGDSINEIPTPSKTDYNFDGWVDTNGKKYTVSDTFTENVELKARWVERNYSLVFHSGENAEMFAPDDSSDKTVKTVKVVHGGTLNELPGALYYDTSGNLLKNEYTLEGWYPNADFTGEKLTADTPINANGEYYAKWVKNVVTEENNNISYSIHWGNSTASVVSNVDDNLCFHPNTTADIVAELRLTFDKKAASNSVIEKGTIKFKVPKYVFKDWKGNNTGKNDITETMEQYSESGTASGDMAFSYQDCGEYYLLINNRDLEDHKDYHSVITIQYSASPWNINGGAIDKDGNYVSEYPCYTNTIHPTLTVGDTEKLSKDLSLEVHTKVETTQSKDSPSVSFSWNDNWGSKPADADDYFYITWRLTERSAQTNQPYQFIWTEQTVHDGTVVMEPGNWTTVDRSSRNYYQYIVTKHPKSVLSDVEGDWKEINNEAVVTERWNSGYETYHRVNATARVYIQNAHSGGPRYFTKQIPDYTAQDAHVINGGQEDIIDDEKNVKLPYAILYTENEATDRVSEANNEKGYTAAERTYTIEDGYNNSIFISDGKPTQDYNWNDNGIALTENDYYFSSLKITVSEFDTTKIDANWMEPYENTDRDSYDDVAVYVHRKGEIGYYLHTSYRPLAVYDVIDLPEDTVAFKVVHKSSFYTTNITVEPTMYLKPSSKVQDIVADHVADSLRTFIKNEAKMTISQSGSEDDVILSHTAGESAWPEGYELSVSETNLYASKNCASQSKVELVPSNSTERMAAVISGWNYNDSGRTRRLRSGIFYDLLPVGYSVEKDSIFVVPRLIKTDDSDNSGASADNYNQIYNTADKLPAAYYDVKFENNYNGSGQIMMTVKVNIPDDYRINGEVVNGVDVYYMLVTSYENIFIRGEHSGNSVAFVNTTSSQANPAATFGDIMTIAPEYRRYFSTIEEENKARVAYAYRLTNAKRNETYTITFKNTVKTNDKYLSNETTGINSPYTYRISYAQSDTQIKNLVLYDVLENGTELTESEWRGTFKGIDVSTVSSIVNQGNDQEDYCAPVVYYSTKNRDEFTDEDLDIKNALVWTTIKPNDEDITAVAVDCSRSVKGNEFKFNGELSFNIYIDMLSPLDTIKLDGTASNDIMAVNSASYKAISTNDNTEKYAKDAVATVVLHKQLPRFTKTSLPESGTQEDPMGVVYQSVLTYDLTVTNPDPNMTLNNIVVKDTLPAGLTVNNAIQVKIGDNAAVNIDSSPRVDYTLSKNEFTATIHNLSPNETITLSIPATVNVDSGTFVNTARITTVNGATLENPILSETTYHDVENMQVRILKVDSNHEPLAGATLRLLRVNNDNTTTQIGTDFVSTNSAVVFENGIVAGTYRLEEVTPPADYKAAEPITFTIDSEGLTKIGDEYVTYVEMVNEPRYKVIFHENKPGGTADEIQKVFRIYEPKDLNTDKTITHFYDIPEWAGDEYVFAGWYHNNDYSECDTPDSAAGTASSFENDAYTEQDTDYHLYAKWIKVGTVAKHDEDTNIISGYRGFGLAGVQIRDPEMYDENYTEITSGGMRFVTSLSEELLSSIDALSTTQVSTPEGNVNVEYGYAVGTEANINDFISHYNIEDTTAYTLQYKGENVNGKNTTVKGSGANTDYRYITNVNCTQGTGQIAKDHRNFTDYRLYTLVVTYDDARSADKKADKIDARSYIRYYDANGKLRVFYNTYRANTYYGGCMCSYNQVSSMALPSNKAETEENP